MQRNSPHSLQLRPKSWLTYNCCWIYVDCSAKILHLPHFAWVCISRYKWFSHIFPAKPPFRKVISQKKVSMKPTDTLTSAQISPLRCFTLTSRRNLWSRFSQWFWPRIGTFFRTLMQKSQAKMELHCHWRLMLDVQWWINLNNWGMLKLGNEKTSPNSPSFH